ncbi:MAG: hypothetical protein KatS3mg081_0642 [Gemmatimonadales bacterium]|nr:MAG: hypothetical protein KatS3mg081_0642 [Gemmatimonadales bacterium]
MIRLQLLLVVVAAGGLLCWVSPLTGNEAYAVQNSVYGIQGIGFPGRPVSIRSRALGGGNAVFDPASALNPAAVAGYTRLIASTGLGTTFRNYTVGDTSVGGLRETRFPIGMVGTPIGGSPLRLAVSFVPYAERSFDVQTTSAAVIRGESLTVEDRIAAEGGVTDFRLAVALGAGSRLLVGGAVHLLAGSSRLRVRRDFSDPQYRSFVQQSDISFSGWGLSAGVVVSLVRGIQLGAALRSDGTLESNFPLSAPERVDLPWAAAAGLRIAPTPSVTWSTTAMWRAWSSATGGLLQGTRAFDTWEIGSGLELGGAGARILGLPLVWRTGVRYASLPFSARDEQPSELVLSGGPGLFLGGGRIALDLAVERASRSGGGAREEAWHVAAGLTVVP